MATNVRVKVRADPGGPLSAGLERVDVDCEALREARRARREAGAEGVGQWPVPLRHEHAEAARAWRSGPAA